MTDLKALLERLRAACVGHPHAEIEWPHRLLHDAIAAIEVLEVDRNKFMAIAEDKLADTRLISAGPGEGGFGFDLKGGPIPYIAEYLFQFIGAREEKGPSNYAEIEVIHHEFGPMTLTMQRRSGQTPHQLRAAAEARAEAAEAEVARLKEALAEISCPTQTERLLWWQLRARDALHGPLCPRPANHRPDGLSAEACIAAGECGCVHRNAGRSALEASNVS